MKLNRPVDARSPRGRPVGAYGVFALSILAATIALAAPREVSVSETVPRLGDHTMLSWREGPPYRTNVEPADAKSAGYSSERRFLRLATGYFAADFDTEKIAWRGASRPTRARCCRISRMQHPFITLIHSDCCRLAGPENTPSRFR